jgi:hypothetical protein
MGTMPAGEFVYLVLKDVPVRATETYSGMEIICISCWRAFDHDTSTAAAQVACPHCGFSQPGPDPSSLNAKLDANTRPSQVASEAVDSPEGDNTSTTDPELPIMSAQEPEPHVQSPPPAEREPELQHTQTAEYEAAPSPAKAPKSPAAQPAIKPDEPPKPDHRWRLKTPARLVLYFPDYESMSRYLTGDEGGGYSVACGPGAFRTLTGFISAMRVTDDPLEALVNVPTADDDATSAPSTAAIPSAPRPRSGARSKAPSTPRSRTNSEPAVAQAGESEAGAQTRPRTRRRRTSANTDFTFRKTQEQNPWPNRIMFLMIGLLAGGAAIYYVAWLGLLPGIVY